MVNSRRMAFTRVLHRKDDVSNKHKLLSNYKYYETVLFNDNSIVWVDNP